MTIWGAATGSSGTKSDDGGSGRWPRPTGRGCGAAIISEKSKGARDELTNPTNCPSRFRIAGCSCRGQYRRIGRGLHQPVSGRQPLHRWVGGHDNYPGSPNQWTQSGSNFGSPWQGIISEFKKVTGITVNTDVLPLATFFSVESTQLAAATAPDLASTRRPTNRTWLSR